MIGMRQRIHRVWKVALVAHQDSLASGCSVDQGLLLSRVLCRRVIADNEYKIGIGECLVRFTDTELFDLVIRTANPCGINHADWDPTQRDRFGDKISRGTRNRRHDSPLAFYEPVEQARLSHVGTTDNGEGDSIMHNAPISK